jgi:CheY-like chemotaxis protein
MTTLQRIVLIDDNDADNEYHEIMIRQAGFAGEIVIIEDPLKALPYFLQADLDIGTYVFLDINMPMMDGFQVAEQLTPVFAGHPTLIVMMLTSSGAQGDRDRAASLDVIRGFVTKPLTAEAAREMFARPFDHLDH